MVTADTLVGPHFAYTDLKLLSRIHGTGLSPGQFEGSEPASALAALAIFETSLPLVVDCHGIVAVGGQVFAPFHAALKDLHRPVVFWNCRGIKRHLDEQVGASNLAKTVGGKWDAALYSRSPEPSVSFLDAIPDRIQDLRNDTIAEAVKSCFKESPGMQRMESSPLLTNGTFDAREIIAKPRSFAWISCFLARLAERTFQEASGGGMSPDRGPQILAVSLRASPLAASVTLLTDFHRGLHILDHVGPKHRILEGYSLTPARPAPDFLYVGDFIVGGTELKIARNYANSLGCRIIGAIALGTLLDGAEYHFDAPIHGLSRLTDARRDFRASVFEGERTIG